MPTKYNRRKRRTRKRGGYLDPENEKLLNDTFTEAPTYEELFKFQQEKMQNKNYSEILKFIFNKFNISSLPTN